MLLAATMLCVCSCSKETPIITPNPAVDALEQDFFQAKKDIAKLQTKMRMLLEKMIDDIQREKIDAKATSIEVRETIEEVRQLKERVMKLRHDPALSSTKGPLS